MAILVFYREVKLQVDWLHLDLTHRGNTALGRYLHHTATFASLNLTARAMNKKQHARLKGDGTPTEENRFAPNLKFNMVHLKISPW